MATARAPVTRRAEIQNLYQSHASGQETMSVYEFLKFLRKVQKESISNVNVALSLLNEYEIDETAKENRSLTFEGFYRYMESKDNCVFNQAHTVVYQDMDQPLTNYFISSSHNTYLVGGQLVGKSHTDAYMRALRKGCRCLEIDCWDGDNMEPTVYHGHTLTTKILFKDVITTVAQHAFAVSPYPVILSLENHCSPQQQQVMAYYLELILGDMLLRAPLDNAPIGQLPSPNRQKLVVANALSDLVIYTRSVKFISFSHSANNQKFNENTSMPETTARKLINESAVEFVQHNQKFLSRIYPGCITDNLAPQQFWNVGAQLVALNFQKTGSSMALNDGRFQDNGACGYVLKPRILQWTRRTFNPLIEHTVYRRTTLNLQIISGSNLPTSEGNRQMSPLVKVEIHGIPSDSCKKWTRVIKSNSLNPRWDEEMIFNISIPELCLVRFCLYDHPLLRSNFVGQYTLPFTSLKKGYRWVPLLTLKGKNLDPASLFVFVS
ncbi:1-phosphatidylinositol 4,5-bisphosphate phosphodiesterase zeta-1-like [Antennarius striatus]|uniref:1-phosphatidylinositol 4,5-bisphosphate phosphodiesterase zeta-1-like n=1 Tax=Antennarius striatus TaxID=241820 RepID=UPI0035AE07F1